MCADFQYFSASGNHWHQWIIQWFCLRWTITFECFWPADHWPQWFFLWLLDFSEQSLTIVYKHIERPLANPMVLERPLQISFFCRISSPLNIFWYSMAFQWFLLSMVKNCWWNDGIVLNHRSGLGWALKRVWRWQQSLQECQIRLQSKSNCNRRTVNVTEHKVTTTTAKGCLYITF